MSIILDESKLIAARPTKRLYHIGDHVVKVFDENYSKSDVLNEALNQSRVENCELFVPKIQEVMKVDGKWAIVYDYVEGETLSSLMSAYPEKDDEYLRLFVRLQAEVHSKTIPLLSKLRDKMTRKIGESPIPSDLKFELHIRLNSQPSGATLCHGDFNPSNIIISNNGDAYILDWAHATQGNREADVARTFLLFSLDKGKDYAEKYLDTFVSLAYVSKKVVYGWVPIVAASQLVKRKPEERDFLLSFASVFEYE